MLRAPHQLQARMLGATMPTAPASLSEFLASKGFKGAPEKPRYGTRDMAFYTDAFGNKTSGSSTDAQYHQKLSEFFKSNPGAMEAAQERKKSQQFQVSGPVNGLHQGPLGPPQEIKPSGIENLSGSLGGQIRPSPYSAPQMPQMGGGYGGGQGMQQFMQFMQTMMQMFQQLQGGGGRGMGGGFQGQMRPRPQTYGRSPYGGY
tara:strand:- start:55 stop:660 length:606 start_codon:yes stop_codon:yes gene_type:complete